MNLYKYFHPDRTNVLSNGLLRFTQPGAFNDPYEMQAFIDKSLLERDLKKLLDENYNEIMMQSYNKIPENTRTVLSFEKYKEMFKNKKPQLLSEISKGSKFLSNKLNETLFQPKANQLAGVLCLTEKPDNLLMWAHYANCHEGFVIEFDSKHEFFNKESSDKKTLKYIQKVKYNKNIPTTSLLDLKNFDFILTKSLEWEYEQEWRKILPLEGCNKKIPAEPYDIFLYEYPKIAIKKVILGCRAKPEMVDQIKLALSCKELSHVKLEKAELIRSQYGLKFNAIGI